MGRRLLVIEPSLTIRTLLDIYLHRNGNQLTIFADYADALHALVLPSIQAQPPELVLIRLRPAQEESYRLIEYLRQQPCYVHTKIVGLIAQEDEGHRQFQRLVREAQVVALINPFRIQNLLALVAEPGYMIPDVP
jgi:CheY-like chemotaxis protein